MDIAAFLTHPSNKIAGFPQCVGNDGSIRSMPSNLGERRPKINSACAVASYLVSKCPVDDCFELFVWSPDALTRDPDKVISVEKGKDPSP